MNQIVCSSFICLGSKTSFRFWLESLQCFNFIFLAYTQLNIEKLSFRWEIGQLRHDVDMSYDELVR